MNLSRSQTNKRRLSPDQLRLLEASFDAARKLEPERKLQLAAELGVPPRQIAIWYQNKRARWKSQSLELDYALLQKRLEAALVEKRQLAEEADRLRGELKRARDMLLGFKWARAQSQPCAPLSGFCNDGWAAVDHDAVAAELPFEEVYSCLMSGGDAQEIFYSKQ